MCGATIWKLFTRLTSIVELEKHSASVPGWTVGWFWVSLTIVANSKGLRWERREAVCPSVGNYKHVPTITFMSKSSQRQARNKESDLIFPGQRWVVRAGGFFILSSLQCPHKKSHILPVGAHAWLSSNIITCDVETLDFHLVYVHFMSKPLTHCRESLLRGPFFPLPSKLSLQWGHFHKMELQQIIDVLISFQLLN